MSRVLVFGTFDGLHEGHRAMLQEAGKNGEVVICLALDKVVERLKGRSALRDYQRRAIELMNSGLVAEVVAGDEEMGTYACLERAKPDVIAFGYDQQALRQDLVNWQQQTRDETPHIVLQPYRPETYKSSLLRSE